ncbi:nitronate monooxygenase [Acidimicrobiia bacterium EGI L10123]|uniref:NAD(P)H-dependent flavin oxidoreductase n=1 Tax=Salinilacustrithrix flava TaxID=2957203 RepID=UPI003D7C2240|nr:nitronate monooxygenase [Acidimicrobiia bacterium EGI L10123]
MPLRTRFSELFGLTHPLMSAPMVMHSGGRLAGAVSAAGALGSFGGMHPAREPDWVRDEIALARQATDRPFAVGFITPFLPMAEPFLEAAIEAQPAAVVLSFADPGPWAARLADAGISLICQVQDHDGATQAVDAGAAVLVVQGMAAGGHTGTLSLLPFLSATVERFPDVPVLAAGGIADGRALAAALLAGADGAVMGTAFLATPEAVEIDDRYKQLIVDSDGTDTVLTQVFDIISGLPWPAAVHDRVRRNRTTDQWSEREAELRVRREEVAATLPPTAHPDPERDAIRYGQSAGAVGAIRPAAEVAETVCRDAEAILRQRPATLLG